MKGSESVVLNTIELSYVFNQSIGARDCSVYQFTVMTRNVVGSSGDSPSASAIIPTSEYLLQL